MRGLSPLILERGVPMITEVDIALFLQTALDPFAPFLFFAFVLMLSFTVLMGVKRLLTWGY